jgi:formylglycine-generating enzyme required for sulfatase activity
MVTLNTFALDTFEVTVGRFRNFVNAPGAWAPASGAGPDPSVPGSGWQTGWPAISTGDWGTSGTGTSCGGTWSVATGTYENAAISCVDWYEAFAFCAWDGGWLPTEAEWEYAARSTDHRIYPWGATDPQTTPLANDAYTGNSPTIPVGSYPTGNGPFGHSDQAGGMWEWVMDWYSGSYYGQWPTEGDGGSTCNNCANIFSAGSYRVIRGGSWSNVTNNLRAAYRSDLTPTNRGSVIGFRCARTP